jgi:hypothetical protein
MQMLRAYLVSPQQPSGGDIHTNRYPGCSRIEEKKEHGAPRLPPPSQAEEDSEALQGCRTHAAIGAAGPQEEKLAD